MREKEAKIDPTLKELLVGIVLFEVLAMGIGIWFVKPRGSFVIGILAGLLVAVFYAVHMYWSIDRNLEINGSKEGAANAYAVKSSMIRYAVASVGLLACVLVDVTCLLTAFVGIMGIKAGAYLQPFTHKYIFRNQGFSEHTEEENKSE